MTRSAQILGTGSRVNKGLYRLRPVAGRNTRGTAMPKQIYRDSKRSFMQSSIIIYHQAQPQLVTPAFFHRRTDKPPPVLAHEIDHLRGDIPCSSDKITLILPILIINHDHQLASLYVLNGALNT